MPNVKIKNYVGDDCIYEDVDKVWLASEQSTDEEPDLLPFTYGEAIEGVEVEPDFSAGDMTVTMPEGYLVKEATLKKPEKLIPGNIKAGETVAGVTGEYESPVEALTVTENGTYTPPEGVAGFNTVVVNVDPTKITILREQQFDGFVLDESFGAYSPGFVSPAEFVLNSGETYHVIWDGTEYECTAVSFEYYDMSMVAIGDGSYLGLPGNGEPFLITYNIPGDGIQFFSNEDAESHTVGIWQKTEAIEVTVDLDFSTGDMVVESDDKKAFSKVNIPTPENLIPENVAEGVNIAGIIGTLSAGAEVKIATGTISNELTSKTVINHGLGVIPDIIIHFHTTAAYLNNTSVFSIIFSKAFTAETNIQKAFVVSKTNNTISFDTYSVNNDSASLPTGGIAAANENTFTISASSSYHVLSGTVWIAIAGLTE